MSIDLKDVSVTLGDFRKCGWENVIQNSKDDYCSMWQSLYSFAENVIKENKLSEAKAILLLSEACGMRLNPSSLNEPFIPYRFSIPLNQYFDMNSINFFSEIVDEIESPKLRARIADIVWLLQNPRNKDFAIKAIDAYMQIPLTDESIKREGFECWERAIRLCLQLKGGATKQLQLIETDIVSAIKNASIKDDYLALHISKLLAKFEQHQLDTAEKLEKLAIEFYKIKQIKYSCDYFEETTNFYKKLNMLDKFSEMLIKTAECWIEKATTQQNYNMRIFYESAIQTYRKVPKQYRNSYNYNIDSKIEEIILVLKKIGQKCLNQMETISSEPIDISEYVKQIQNDVKDKNITEALSIFTNLYNTNIKEITENAKTSKENNFISAWYSTTIYLSADGRKIAQTNSDDSWGKIIQLYSIGICLAVALIRPALEQIQLEHRLTEMDFYLIVNQSPIVPLGREKLIAKGLFAGYDDDFVTALHILVPQIEHLVRIQLRGAGVKTSTLDKNGIETENGLSTLMENPEVNTIFGEDLAFEIKALFCDALGANLRNNVAHGLLDYEESQSIYSVYAWWLILRIVFNTFWKNATANK